MLPDYYRFFFDLFNNLGVPFSLIPLMMTLTISMCALIIAGFSYLIYDMKPLFQGTMR